MQSDCPNTQKVEACRVFEDVPFAGRVRGDQGRPMAGRNSNDFKPYDLFG